MSFSRLVRTVQMALKSLLLHRLRSGLTMLGIVFGVFSVIAMLAIGEGASEQAQKQVLELGATNIIVRSVEPPEQSATQSQGQGAFVKRYGLLKDDYELLAATVPNLVKITRFREVTMKASNRDRSMDCRLVGCTEEYRPVNHLELAEGRFLGESDENANVAVITEDVAKELFRLESPLGKSVRIDDKEPYRIVGITRRRTATAAIGGSLSGQDYNKDIYIPLTTMRTHVNRNNLSVQRKPGQFSATHIELHQITLQVKSREDVLRTEQVVRESLELHHKDTKDYAIIVPLQLLKQADQIRRIFNIVLGSIAAISLVVGGIGIMNIMLATVTERTREIGIRRALGARQQDITTQFLTETIVLAGTGGLIGVVLGLLTPYIFRIVRWFVTNRLLEASTANSELGRMFSGMEPVVQMWSLFVAFGISVGIGIIFGIYPAWSAAKLDPIEALRHE